MSGKNAVCELKIGSGTTRAVLLHLLGGMNAGLIETVLKPYEPIRAQVSSAMYADISSLILKSVVFGESAEKVKQGLNDVLIRANSVVALPRVVYGGDADTVSKIQELLYLHVKDAVCVRDPLSGRKLSLLTYAEEYDTPTKSVVETYFNAALSTTYYTAQKLLLASLAGHPVSEVLPTPQGVVFKLSEKGITDTLKAIKESFKGKLCLPLELELYLSKTSWADVKEVPFPV
jgi:hypothetical protein